MAARRGRVSVVALVALLAIAVVSVVGYLITRHATDQQQYDLLRDDTEQVAQLLQSDVSGLHSSLGSLAAVASITHGSTSAFSAQATLLAKTSPNTTYALVHRTGTAFTVLAAVGPSTGLTPGTSVSGATAAALRRAGAALATLPARHSGDTSVAGFSLAPPTLPAGMVVMEEVRLHTYLAPAAAGKAFDNLNAAFYAGTTQQPSTVLLTTSRHLPLTGQVALVPLQIGGSTWLVAGSPRGSLIGSVASTAPILILLLGLLVAVLVAAALQVLVLRHRYALGLVQERTAALDRSLTDLRQAQDTLVRQERLSAVGEMASVVGHELRNPLTAVNNALYLVRLSLGTEMPPLAEQNLALAEREVGKAASLAADLTAFVRPREVSAEPFELTQVVEEVLQTLPPPPGVELRRSLQDVTVVADRIQVAEVLTNLVDNAYQAVVSSAAAPVPEEVAVSADRRVGGGGDGDAPGAPTRRGAVTVGVAVADRDVAITVEDTGPGLQGEAADRAFEPFFTTKSTGTGLGLAIVQRIVDAHHGTVGIEPGEGGGARLTVRLPRVAQAATS